MSSDNSHEPSEHKPPAEIGALISEASPYIFTLRMFFTSPEELGRKIESREWDGISKPLAAGSGSVGFTAVTYWLIGENPNIGKFHEFIFEFIKDWPFFLAILGFLVVVQLVAKRGIAQHTLISSLIVTTYALAFFLFPFFAGLSILVHFSNSFLSMGEWPGLLTFLLLAGVVAHTLLHSYPRCLSGAFGRSDDLVFGTFIVYLIAATLLPKYLFF